MITQERLLEVLHYDPETGIWTWLSGRFKGKQAGSRVDKDRGYLRVTVDGRKLYLHRLAFLYMTGQFPPADVDHINMNKGDCRWVNLRAATRSQNFGNKPKRTDNTSGLKGVWWHKQIGRWAAEVKKKKLGVYDCRAAAYFACLVESDKQFGEFARAS